MTTTDNKKSRSLLVDTKLIRLNLVEGDDSGKIRVRGEFARAGQATENKRVYPSKIWEKEIGRLDGAMKDRRVFGEMDHPLDGRTSLNRVSHIVTSMTLEDGVLVGEAEIMPTDKGRNLMALLKSGCKVGVSSRGFGSTKSNDKGEEVVQEDYRLVTFDFVADPADQTAYPDAFFEGVEIERMLTKEEEKTKAKEWARRIEAAAKAQEDGKPEPDPSDTVADEMLAKLAEMRDELKAEIRGELMSDPTVARARVAIDEIKNILRPFVLPEDAEAVVKGKESEISRLKKESAEKDLKIKDLEADNAALAEAAKVYGYTLFIERQVVGDPDAALIVRLMGDLKGIADAKALQAKLAEVRQEAAQKRTQATKVEESKSREVLRAREIVREVTEQSEEKIATLTDAVEKLVTANKMISLQLYVEKKLRNNPRSAKIRSLIESAKPESKAEVDEIFEQLKTPAPKDADDAADTRSRIRNTLKSGGSESSTLEEETPRKPIAESNYNGLGMDLGDLQRLSGIHK